MMQEITNRKRVRSDSDSLPVGNIAKKLLTSSFNKMPLQLTKPAPQFKTTAVVNGEFKDVSLADYKGKYVVLFFYPLDFTFVCPTEIIAFSERADDFRKIGCELLQVRAGAARQWRKSVRDLCCSVVLGDLGRQSLVRAPPLWVPAVSDEWGAGWIHLIGLSCGLGPMNLPIISDKSHRIARDYGVLDEETGIPFRGLFIIDPKQNLRQITINDLPVGRLVQAFQYTDKYGEVCPANWHPGSKTIKPDTKAAKEYFVDAN
ncbi:unnamed protein product [Leptidea sinapis]|uniref:thioredoxin-dependent peroxiredoxin n=1 Tax=Leptidea sinapis TaxID=189913 RepID=A0A5E4R6B8_9NEOP|nr:unnamed protein product [Leptidea sinapis]